MKAPFLGQAYQSRSPVLSSQTAINIYPELTEGNADEVGAFYGTPGLTGLIGSLAGETRGLYVAQGYLYGVIGDTIYRFVPSTATATPLINTLPNSTGKVSMVSNETQVVVAHQDGWHWFDIGGAIANVVAGAPTTSSVTSQDNYVIFPTTDGMFGITALADLSTIDPLDVADAEGDPDDLVTVFSDHREAWLFGEDTTEIWSNTGAALFPFERQPGGFIEMGCAAKFSVAKLDNSVFWLGRDRNGQGIVYRSNGYVPVRISTHAIEHAINGYSDISDAFAYSYQEEGHAFYVLTFPTGDATWVYDVATRGWHQRAWLGDDGLLHRHRANCYANFEGMHLVGDVQGGAVLQMSLDAYTDDGDEIYRERAFMLPEVENKKGRIDEVEILATIGDGLTPVDGSAVSLWLEVSRDSGRTFGYQRILSTGAIGETKARFRWRRCGTGRDIVLKVATTMGNRVHWVAGFVHGEVYDQ